MSGEQASYEPISRPPSPSASQVSPWAFWVLGLLNNTSFVIMVAGAKYISQGGTALIFLSNSLPSLAVTLTAPYWFHLVSYQKRLSVASFLMAASFAIVAAFSTHRSERNLLAQLLGVALTSAQCGLGEASLLALAGVCDHGREMKSCLTAFSSGTGVAGIFGFLWLFIFRDCVGVSMETAFYLAIGLAALYGYVYYKHLWRVHFFADDGQDFVPVSGDREDLSEDIDNDIHEEDSPRDQEEFHDEAQQSAIITTSKMTFYEQMRAVLRLWPYMIPLFTVYAAEYSLQAGIWTAIGFPVQSEQARDKFYEYSNWMYQVGVFLSRSSGTIYVAPTSILWLMPILQTINVAFFWWVAKYQVFYSNFLLLPAFYVGLLGGAVYINGYTRICVDIPIQNREFALCTTSVAAGLGIVVADLLGLLLQACLYKIHDIEGAVASCPFNNP